jgi:hypothetical protein
MFDDGFFADPVQCGHCEVHARLERATVSGAEKKKPSRVAAGFGCWWRWRHFSSSTLAALLRDFLILESRDAPNHAPKRARHQCTAVNDKRR